MGIEDKSTYGEYYWAMQVEAQSAFDEQVEQVISPMFRGIINDIPEISELPTGTQTFLRLLAEPPSPGLGSLLQLTGAEFAAEIIKDALAPALSMLRRSTNTRSRETWLNAQQAVTLSQRKKIGNDYFYLLTAAEGYEDIVADSLYTSMLPYPTISDIMLYARYHGDPEHTREIVWKKFDVPVDDYELWEWQGLERLTTDDIHTLYRRGIIEEPELRYRLSEIGWRDTPLEREIQIGWSIPNAMLLVQGNLFAVADNEKILKDIQHADIHPDYAQTYLDAVLTKPATTDLISYMLRMNPDMPDAERELKRIGIHPDYIDVYKTLAHPIPPVADIITMAVREAFSPEIAERFGQYEDFPPEFEQYAAQKGLTKEWASRYWAAHWNLPSPTQGFDMLHRGIIDVETLNTLLRAQDVMPFWRDKLIQIAYRPLTRVDVRRMYREGILDEGEVYEAYKIAGYDDRNAERMAKFTVKQTLSTLSKFSSTDIIKAYVSRMISRSDADALLQEIGIRGEDAQYIISTADYKRQWDLTDSRIKGIKNLYSKFVYDDNEARDKLAALNLPAEQINVLMEQWFYDIKGEAVATWTTAQTLSFLKKGLINRTRAITELKLNGYDDEHISIYLQAAK